MMFLDHIRNFWANVLLLGEEANQFQNLTTSQLSSLQISFLEGSRFTMICGKCCSALKNWLCEFLEVVVILHFESGEQLFPFPLVISGQTDFGNSLQCF